jgi:periplasmic protein TonB
LNTPQINFLSPLQVSLATHGFMALFFGCLLFFRVGETRLVDFDVIQNPMPAPSALLNPAQPTPKLLEQPLAKRKVFGSSRKTVTDDTSGVEVKLGNTLATSVDDKTLTADDEESLPIPTDEYLVSSMPTPIGEIRIPYPPNARARGIEGPVIMEILVDAAGSVRQVRVVSGPDTELIEAAQKAIVNLKFNPARLEKRAVAVLVRYIYRFVLEK